MQHVCRIRRMSCPLGVQQVHTQCSRTRTPPCQAATATSSQRYQHYQTSHYMDWNNCLTQEERSFLHKWCWCV